MSVMRSVALDVKMQTLPPVPILVMTALGTVPPVVVLRLDTVGRAAPHG